MTIITIGQNSTDTFTGITDTELEQGAPDTNKATNDIIEVTKFGAGDHRDGMIITNFGAFRTSIANAPITLASAVLNWWADTAAPGGLINSVYESLRAAIITQATWNSFATASSWTSGGGRGNGTDRNATALGAFTSISSGQFNQAVLDAARVQAIINAGNLLIMTIERTDAENDSNFSSWRASENAIDLERPFITLDYTLAAAGASPSLLLIGVG